MGLISQFFDIILHLDKYLGIVISTYGVWTYAILFVIVFLETGLVLTPFLPGDSLLFASGALAGIGLLNIWLLFTVLLLAAILGDTMNYWVGNFLGNKVLDYRPVFMNKFIAKYHAENSRRLSRSFLNPKHTVNHVIYWIYKYVINDKNINMTKKFFTKHGSKTIILARFVPIVRTFAPFLAGIGKMDYWKFLAYNVIGAIMWVAVFCLGGYFFGNLVWVQQNFTLVLIIIILLSLMPAVYHLIKEGVFKGE